MLQIFGECKLLRHLLDVKLWVFGWSGAFSLARRTSSDWTAPRLRGPKFLRRNTAPARWRSFLPRATTRLQILFCDLPLGPKYLANSR